MAIIKAVLEVYCYFLKGPNILYINAQVNQVSNSWNTVTDSCCYLLGTLGRYMKYQQGSATSKLRNILGKNFIFKNLIK